MGTPVTRARMSYRLFFNFRPTGVTHYYQVSYKRNRCTKLITIMCLKHIYRKRKEDEVIAYLLQIQRLPTQRFPERITSQLGQLIHAQLKSPANFPMTEPNRTELQAHCQIKNLQASQPECTFQMSSANMRKHAIVCQQAQLPQYSDKKIAVGLKIVQHVGRGFFTNVNFASRICFIT